MTKAPMLLVALLALAACSDRTTENVAIDINNASPSEIEALPPDESSATPTNELASGSDNADVTDLNTSENAY
ncbi:MAG TPA: hypothetical protein VFY95_07625 [Sphingomicrobium sp.]